MMHFIRGAGVKRLVVNDTLYSALVRSSLRDFVKEVYEEMKVWKRDLPSADQVYVSVREQMVEIRRKLISVSQYLGKGNLRWKHASN
jgi:hypothetical protein